jgi:hypothetical protein
MDLLVSLSLFLNVFLDLLLISMKPDCVDVVSCSPKLTTPEKLLDFRVSEKDFPGCEIFRDLSSLGRKHHRNRLDQKVDMVFVSADFHKVHVVSRGKLDTDFLEGLFYRFSKDFTAVLCRTDQVVKYAVYVVSFSYVLRHAFSISLHGLREHPAASCEEIYLII